MQLLILILVSILIGYMLADSFLADRVGETSKKASKRTKDWLNTVTKNFRILSPGKSKTDSFREWVRDSDNKSISEGFRNWFLNLPKDQALKFTKALDIYSESLGFDLDQLIDGSLDKQPRMKLVFVEAVVVYSDAYRKAREVNKQQEEEEAREKSSSQKRSQAEKSKQRQKEPVAETAESQSTA